MNFIPEYQTVRLDNLVRLGVVQVAVDTIIVPKSDALIENVLSVSCDSIVHPSEVFSGEARFGGNVTFKVMYVDTNGTIQMLQQLVDFSDKVVNSTITQSTKPIFSSIAIGTNTSSVSSHELRLATTVEVRLDGIVRQELNCLVGGGENVYVNNSQVEYSTCIHDVVDSPIVQDTLSNLKDARILGGTAAVHVKSSATGADVVVCSGNIVSTVFYINEGEILKSIVHSTPFVQEVAAGGVNASHNVQSTADVKSIRLGDVDEQGNVEVEVQLALRVIVFASTMFSPVVDAYSLHNDLNITNITNPTSSLRRQLQVEDRVEGNISLDDSALADTILSVNNTKVYISTQRCMDNNVVLEGILESNVVYFNADLNSRNVVKAEIPFSLSFNQELDENDNVSARGIVQNINTKIRRGNEIELRFDVSFVLTITGTQDINAISEIELGEARELPTAAFSIHIAKPQETLWEISKVLGATPENILKQNSNLVFPLIGGERVVTYRQLTNT